MRPKEQAATEELFASLQHFAIAPPAARLAGEFKRDYARKGITLNLGDVMMTLFTDYVKGLSDGEVIASSRAGVKHTHMYRRTFA